MDTVAVPSPVPGQPYANIGTRFMAAIIDSLLLWFINFFLSRILSLTGSQSPLGSGLSNLAGSVIGFGYYVYFTGSTGQTLGKKIMKIKVVQEDTRSVPGYSVAFIREVVGKLISGFVFGLGYILAVWDTKKQGWHDKIAKTIVVTA